MSKSGASSDRSSISGTTSVPTGGPLLQDSSSSLPITVHRLNGQNYMQWAQSVMMYVSGKGKDDYLTGEVVVPSKEDPKYKSWRAENNMVMSWLINTMDNDIGQNFMFYGTAKDVWEAARETYSDSRNTAEILEIKGALHDLRQGEFTVSQYYNTLTRYWQQLDMYEELEWDCPGDSLKFRKIVEKERIFKFLLGLNKNLDEVRGRIFGMKPLPTIREVFSEVRMEESRRKIMLSSQEGTPTAERSALSSQSAGVASQGSSVKERKPRPGNRPWCDYCKKPGHTKETCWKLHGKPQDWNAAKTRDKGSTGLTAGIGDEAARPGTSSFSKEQLETLQKMFQQLLPSQPTATGAVAQTGKTLQALGAMSNKKRVWIVDSGASDHMTGDASLLHDLYPCVEGLTVKIADGTTSLVKGMGSTHLTPTLTLNSVLYIPNLSYNLLSMSKFTKDLNCIAKFFPTHCVFQDLSSWRTIGNVKESGGLYLFEASGDPRSPTNNHRPLASSTQSLNSSDSLIML